jgi:hypothetical protein
MKIGGAHAFMTVTEVRDKKQLMVCKTGCE